MQLEDQPQFIQIEDEQFVIEKAKSGCKSSMGQLYEKYLPYLRNTASKLERYHKNVDFDDAMQQGAVYFIDAVKSYDKSRGKSLKYWIVTCVSLQLVNFWKEQTIIRAPKFIEKGDLEEKASVARNSLSFSEIATSHGNGINNSRDWQPESKCELDNPVHAAIAAEEKEILHSAIDKLTPFEALVIRGRLQGMTYEECGEMACERLGFVLSTHREAMRQRVGRAFKSLEKKICEVMNWNEDALKEGIIGDTLNRQSPKVA